MKANGVIIKYELYINGKLEIAHNQMHQMQLPPGQEATIEITATNSVGESPNATLFIPRSDQGILKTSVFFISYFKQFITFLISLYM